MNYKNKYLKYKNKYLKLSQKGGTIIPDDFADDYYWFKNIIVLSPFYDINLEFPGSLKNNSIIYDNINKIKDYYISLNIDLNNRRNLLNLTDINFNDDNFYMSLNNVSLDKILNECNIHDNVINNAKMIINQNKGDIIKFNAHDYIINNFKDHFSNLEKKFKIHKINKILYDNSNEIENKTYNTYKIYKDVDVVIRDPINDDPNNIVFILFGYWGDNNFQLYYNLNKNHSGMILYFIDRDNKWYDDKIGFYINIIKKYAKYNKYAFYGMSMGGYASLIASLYFDDKQCICIPSSPQTASFLNMTNIIIDKSQIENDNYSQKVNPLPLIKINIPKLLLEKKGYTTKIYCLIGKSECEDKEYLHLDQYHIGMIINFPNVSNIIYNISTHSLGYYLNVGTIIQTISSNFDVLFNDQIQGNTILFNGIKKREK